MSYPCDSSASNCSTHVRTVTVCGPLPSDDQVLPDAQIEQMYADGPRCEAAMELARDRLDKVVYEHPSQAIGLPSRLYDTTGLGNFERDVLDQHRALLYMFLLGVPRDTARLINPKWQPPSPGHRDTEQRRRALPC